MKSRIVLWLGAVVCLAAGWIDPPRADASDFLVRIHHVSPDESEPEVPNGTVRAPEGVAVESGPGISRLASEAAVIRPDNWFTRVLRILRSVNLGGLAR